jgi:hypothetical protein
LIVIQAKSPLIACAFGCLLSAQFAPSWKQMCYVESLRVYTYSRTAAVRAREALWEKDLPASAVVLLTSAASSTVVLLAVMLLVMGETQTPESYILTAVVAVHGRKRERAPSPRPLPCGGNTSFPAQRKDTLATWWSSFLSRARSIQRLNVRRRKSRALSRHKQRRKFLNTKIAAFFPPSGYISDRDAR